MNNYLQNLPYDIKELVYISYGVWKYIWILLIIILVVVMFLLFFRLLLKKFRICKDNPQSELWNILVSIENNIKNLSPQTPFDKRAQVDFFYRLCFLLRMYLEQTTDIPATNLTYDEIEYKLQQSNIEIDPEYKLEILKYLKKGDIIKFSEEVIDIEHALKYKDKVAEYIRLLNRKKQEEQHRLQQVEQ